MEEIMKKIKELDKEKQLSMAKEIPNVASAEDFITLLGKYDINITAEMAKKSFEKINETTEVSKEELSSINGAGFLDTPFCMVIPDALVDLLGG